MYCYMKKIYDKVVILLIILFVFLKLYVIRNLILNVVYISCFY